MLFHPKAAIEIVKKALFIVPFSEKLLEKVKNHISEQALPIDKPFFFAYDTYILKLSRFLGSNVLDTAEEKL